MRVRYTRRTSVLSMSKIPLPSRCSGRASHGAGGRLTPYGQVLFGAAYRNVSRRIDVLTGLNIPTFPIVNPPEPFPGPGVLVPARLTANETAFAMAAGGGLDIRVSKHFSFRLVSVDYVLTRFPSLTTGENLNQNRIRASAGILFTFGEQ